MIYIHKVYGCDWDVDDNVFQYVRRACHTRLGEHNFYGHTKHMPHLSTVYGATIRLPKERQSHLYLFELPAAPIFFIAILLKH